MVCAAQFFFCVQKRAKRAGCGRGRTPAGLELPAVVIWPYSRGGAPRTPHALGCFPHNCAMRCLATRLQERNSTQGGVCAERGLAPGR